MADRVTNIRRLLLLAVILLPTLAGAHEMRPGYLEIRETAVDTFDVLWKVPAQGDNMRMGLYVRFDDDVKSIAEPVAAFVGNTHIQRMKITRSGGLTGSAVTIDGLTATFTDVLLRLERINGTDITRRLTPDQPSYVFEAEPNRWQVAGTYFALGVEHILSGVDHLLFVLALLMVVVGWRRLVGTVTAFTVAHSITLALASLVAAEIIRGRQGNPGLTARLPWIVAFSFGLLHGFGFAGALSEIGLPQSSIPLALFTFNVGVEVGQLLFIAAIMIVYGIGKRLQPITPEWAWRVPTYAIGGIAAFWVIERVAGFWA
jgi:hypothetical protein